MLITCEFIDKQEQKVKQSFKEKVTAIAKKRGYTLKSLYPELGYKSYTGFLRALENETLKGPVYDKLITLIGPLDSKASSIQSVEDENKQLASCLQEVKYLRQIIELKDQLLKQYETAKKWPDVTNTPHLNYPWLYIIEYQYALFMS